jgi:cobalt-zinc-cadmium efflux system membrane fusion protein
LTGAVEYNDFKTTPVIAQVGGPVSRVLVVQGEHVHAGQTLLYIASPDYSVLALRLSEGARRVPTGGQILPACAQTSMRTMPSPRPTSSRRNPRARRRRLTSNPVPTPSGFSALTDPETIVTKPASPEIPLYSPVAGEVVDRQCSVGQLLAAGATQCFTLSDMSSVWILVNVYQNDVAYVHVGDAVTIENESYPGRGPRQDRIYFSRA